MSLYKGVGGNDFHTIRLDLAPLGGMDLLVPRAAEKH